MLVDIAVAVPPYKVLQTRAVEELKKRMADRPAVARIIDAASAHSGIESRHVVVPDAEEAAASRFYETGNGTAVPGTKARMEEYEKWSKELVLKAANDVISENSFDAQSIGRLITISCTGFFAPGLDAHLMRELRLPRTVRRTNIGFMGCAASLVGFGNVLDAQGSAGERTGTLLVSVELCSLHLHTEPTKDNILANTIFADGAAAALFSPDPPGDALPRFHLVRSASVMFDGSTHAMGWTIGDAGFEMVLSQELPGLIRSAAVPALIEVLRSFGIRKEEISYWALHPGGRAILDALQEGLTLGDREMQPSRNVLREYGNMSSASILFVLKEILRTATLRRGENCCAVAFGPGLTMEVALLTVV